MEGPKPEKMVVIINGERHIIDREKIDPLVDKIAADTEETAHDVLSRVFENHPDAKHEEDQPLKPGEVED